MVYYRCPVLFLDIWKVRRVRAIWEVRTLRTSHLSPEHLENSKIMIYWLPVITHGLVRITIVIFTLHIELILSHIMLKCHAISHLERFYPNWTNLTWHWGTHARLIYWWRCKRSIFQTRHRATHVCSIWVKNVLNVI